MLVIVIYTIYACLSLWYNQIMIHFFKKAYIFLARTLRDFSRNDMYVYSANATLWLVIAAFPLLIVLLSSLRYIPVLQPEQLRKTMLELFPTVPEISELVSEVALHLENGSTLVTTWISGLVTLFSASTGIFAVMKGLARLYGAEKQNWMKYRLIAIGYTLGMLVLVFLALGSKLAASIVIGLANSQLQLEGLQEASGTLIAVLDYTHLFTLIGTFLMAWVLFLFPFEKKKNLKKLFPGAIFTAVSWFIAGKLFTFYITRFWKKSVIYGSLTAVVLIALWVYIMMVILFLGAAINKSLANRDLFLS